MDQRKFIPKMADAKAAKNSHTPYPTKMLAKEKSAIKIKFLTYKGHVIIVDNILTLTPAKDHASSIFVQAHKSCCLMVLVNHVSIATPTRVANYVCETYVITRNNYFNKMEHVKTAPNTRIQTSMVISV